MTGEAQGGEEEGREIPESLGQVRGDAGGMVEGMPESSGLGGGMPER